MKEIQKSSGIDDEVVQDQRQRDNNNLQDERQDQPKEEDVKPRRCKRTRIEKLFGLDFVSFMVENEPTSYREAEVHQMDVKMTFLNGDLEKVLYMNQPEGFMASGLESKVCRLVKPQLKESSQTRTSIFTISCKNVDLKLMDVFVIDSIYVLLCLYIDGIIITRSDKKINKSTNDMLESRLT
ncbi:zinc finger, CCHC-type containing protein [Tanacetum coccineum]